VFQSLLDNAIEYSGEGPPRVHVEAERAGDRWVVSVADQGIGIPPGDHEDVFEVFQRLHSRDEHEGTGIGLALCERLLERHGGDIWVESGGRGGESHPGGRGSTFSFTLPAAEREE
jgi:signal transduction histidine kinase